MVGDMLETDILFWEVRMEGSQLPQANQDPALVEYVSRFAPTLMCDDQEPFRVLTVGYTVFDAPGASFSFAREVDWAASQFPASKAIEFALWWDWDIQHLYELEHVWSYVSEGGDLVAAEASWHGYYVPIGIGAALNREANHPVVYVQPGKHAMVASPAGYEVMRDEAIRAAGPEAGKDGLLDNGLFAGKLGKSPETDRLAEAYLRARAFTPTFAFGRRIDIAPAQLVPWPVLREWIPLRIQWWLSQLSASR